MMRVPLEWLREFVPIALSKEELAGKLTLAGHEVTGIEYVGDEAVFSLEITPNRADCLSIAGLAREVAAVTGQRLKLPTVSIEREASKPKSTGAGALSVRIEDAAACRRYVGRVIEGVRIKPSPEWMRRRLAACGIRAINNIVDITNYVLLETGQPLHAFDADRLRSSMLLVRRARAGETLESIDGVTRTLSPETLVIADVDRAVAIAGVMGGKSTEVVESTTRLVLESAWFDPIVVRRAGRKLGLSSESSYRFERGVDLEGVDAASRRAVQLIAALAGGHEVAAVDVGTKRAKPVTVSLEPSRINRVMGVNVPARQARQALERLGCIVKGSTTRWHVTSPSHRRDLRLDVDLIEEVARIVGYDRLPRTAPTGPLSAGGAAVSTAHREYELRCACQALGLTEIITWSLVSDAELSWLRTGGAPAAPAPLSLVNPLSQDHRVLRPTLLVGALRTVARNAAQGASAIRVFELGHVFAAGPTETRRLGVTISGTQQDWQSKHPASLFALKGLLEQLGERFAGQRPSSRPASVPWAQAGEAFELRIGGDVVGHGGQVSRGVQERFDVEHVVWYGELFVETWLDRMPPLPRVQAPSPFPPVKRDLSLLVDITTPFAQVFDAIRATGQPLAHRVELIDRYTGSQIPAGKHSLTFSIEYREPSRTLTSAEVDEVHRRIGQELSQRFGAQLR